MTEPKQGELNGTKDNSPLGKAIKKCVTLEEQQEDLLVSIGKAEDKVREEMKAVSKKKLQARGYEFEVATIPGKEKLRVKKL